jgi:type VI secretion system protein ImpE
MEVPADLQDTVWLQTVVTWSNEGQVPALIPTRYASTETSEDDLLKLSRRTDWVSHPADTYFGIGQRMLTTDAGDYPLLEVREIVFDTPAA